MFLVHVELQYNFISMRENFVILPVLSTLCVCSFCARCALDASSDCVKVSLFGVLFCKRWKHKSDVNKSGKKESYFCCCFCLGFDGFCVSKIMAKKLFCSNVVFTKMLWKHKTWDEPK